jgi:hypothetical protein
VGRHEETVDGDPGGGGDPDGIGGRVEPPLGDEEPSLEGEREHLVPPCLPSWLREEGERKTLHEKAKECKMIISAR